MRIIYSTRKTEKQCTSLKAATKLFGGDKALAASLLARINALEQAEILKDIVLMPTFHFHNLQGKMQGLFAIDVKARSDKWRIILEPLDDEEQPYHPCNIDVIAAVVRIVRIKELSPHYE